MTRVDINTLGSDGIAGTFTLNNSGLSGTSTEKTIQLNAGASGFALNSTNEVANQSAYYGVIAPGTHRLWTKYYVTAADGVTQYRINKLINSSGVANYGANKIYDITANLESMSDYYMWDAQVGRYFGADEPGKIAICPTITAPNSYTTTPGSDSPSAATDSRWYNTVHVGDNATRSQATRSAKDCPSYNQISWYIWAHNNGLPIYWDNTTQWLHFGGMYTGGVWLPKKDKVMALSGYSGGSDMNSSASGTTNITPTAGKPSNESDYFFLPALGYCDSDFMVNVGEYGTYWSSQSNEWFADYAWRLEFDSGRVVLGTYYRYCGFPLWTVQ